MLFIPSIVIAQKANILLYFKNSQHKINCLDNNNKKNQMNHVYVYEQQMKISFENKSTFTK